MRCVLCRTDDFGLPPERLSEGHVGVRFGHAGTGLRIYFHGEDVTNDCYEANAGDSGWVVVYVRGRNGQKLVCVNSRTMRDEHAVMVKKFGAVRVEYAAAS